MARIRLVRGEAMGRPPPRRPGPPHRHVSAQQDPRIVARRPPSVNRARRLVYTALRDAEHEVERHGGFLGVVKPSQRTASARIDWAWVSLQRLSPGRGSY